MTDIKLNQLCSACNGAGVRKYNPTPNAPLVIEDPCVECGGDGRAVASLKIESDYFDEKFSLIMDELGYIHNKVKKIWNSIKDGEPEE